MDADGILHIDSSAQSLERSTTRRLGRLFIRRWLERSPGARVNYRDLSADPVPPVDGRWIAAAFTDPAERAAAMTEDLALSDRLIDEIASARTIVIGAPMYNYNVPSVLKAWIDQIARVGRTFSFDLARGDWPIEPMLTGKRLVLISSRGEFGFEPGGVRAHLNAFDTAIQACAHYLGVRGDDVHRIVVEYQEFKDARYQRSLAEAEQRARNLADALAAEPSRTSDAPDLAAALRMA